MSALAFQLWRSVCATAKTTTVDGKQYLLLPPDVAEAVSQSLAAALMPISAPTPAAPRRASKSLNHGARPHHVHR